uniref:Uncharacterized protein n=1 Tax=Ceratitis capitata TaxID=7213 RepID=W8C5Q8_CERCA
MFTWSKLLHFLLFAVLCLAICDIAAGAERKCAEYNEYCQEHWECCSNTCLTYSYRCIGKRRPGPIVAQPAMTFDELLESIAEFNMIPATSYNSQPQSDQPEKSGLTLKNLLGARGESESVAAAGPVIQERFGGIEVGDSNAATTNGREFIFFVLQPQDTPRQPKQLKEEQAQKPDEKPTDVPATVKVEDGAEVTTEIETEQASARQCKSIGEKCYRHEECCTQRCHGFLHQCVT